METAPHDIQSTPLESLHLELGAKLVPFAGYAMPLQYRVGIVQEHLHTRAAASLFDVSHMGQIVVEGPAAALERVVPGDIASLGLWRQRYSVLTSETGGILDDLMITHTPEHFFLIVNAANKRQDADHLRARLARDCAIRVVEDHALLALQGPAAASVLGDLEPRMHTLAFMSALRLPVAGVPCLISRSGYTGEDGFEISLPAARALEFARLLLRDPRVAPAGLGARDSLRLEAGLCLAGTDIDATRSPVEAGLSWVLAKKYLAPASAPPHFPGAPIILDQVSHGTPMVRVGIKPQSRIPFRHGLALCGQDGQVAGHVTSGTFGPSVNASIAMGYVARAYAAPGSRLVATIRDRQHTAEIVPMPFTPHRYHR